MSTESEVSSSATTAPQAPMEHQQIKQLLGQRHPFLLVDRILELDAEHAVGIKNVTGTEPFIPGHFPDEPIMPGVYILEAMSQVGGILLAGSPELAQSEGNGFLAGADKVKFKKFVVPGDQIVMRAVKVAILKPLARTRVTAEVDGVEVASAEISYYLP